MQIEKIIHESLKQAANLVDHGSLELIHRNRSKQFVESLADKLRKHFNNHPEICVFSKHYTGNRDRFGLNELLFDILVCDTDQCDSIRGAKLTYAKKAIWAIESEMAQDTRKALFDFNKLVLAHSDNKLFIGPQTTDDDAYLATLLPAACCCDGNVFIALVSHPRRWKGPKRINPLTVNFWQLESNKWSLVRKI